MSNKGGIKKMENIIKGYIYRGLFYCKCNSDKIYEHFIEAEEMEGL